MDARAQSSWNYGLDEWRGRTKAKRLLSDGIFLVVGLALMWWKVGAEAAKDEAIVAILMIFGPVGIWEVGSLLYCLAAAPRRQRNELREELRRRDAESASIEAVREAARDLLAAGAQGAANDEAEHAHRSVGEILGIASRLLDHFPPAPSPRRDSWEAEAGSFLESFDYHLRHSSMTAAEMSAARFPTRQRRDLPGVPGQLGFRLKRLAEHEAGLKEAAEMIERRRAQR